MSRAISAARTLTGPNAAAMKYDILSALGLIGVHGASREQVSLPRLALLVTARYNWRRGDVSMGQAEMARLWGVSERTAKREIKFWVERELLICTKPGVRGRVASYRLNLTRILELSEPFWGAIGSDFSDRMRTNDPVPESHQKVVQLSAKRNLKSHDGLNDPWRAVKQALNAEQPEVFSSWLSDLEYALTGPGQVRVTAPSRFVASYVNGHYRDLIERAVRAVHPDVRQISVFAK